MDKKLPNFRKKVSSEINVATLLLIYLISSLNIDSTCLEEVLSKKDTITDMAKKNVSSQDTEAMSVP